VLSFLSEAHTINTLIFGFVIFLPQFFLRQGLTITNSLAYTMVLAIASLVGCALGAWSSDALGRRPSIIAASIFTIGLGYLYARSNAASDPTTVLLVGFFLVVAIYVQTAMLFGVYTPELFPTEIRLRANGICNTLGRAATVVSPFVVGFLMVHNGLPGVIWLMIGLLVIQIIVVGFWGVSRVPARWRMSRLRRLEIVMSSLSLFWTKVRRCPNPASNAMRTGRVG
jgi:MFS transporter, putative metabolite:H+ symporter